MKNKTKSKASAKPDLFLKWENDVYKYFSFDELAELKFMHFLELILENDLTMRYYLVQDALIGEHFFNGNVPVVKELNSSLTRIYKKFPQVKSFVDDRKTLLNLNYLKA